MSTNDRYSDEYLNAYIDKQLDDTEAEQFLADLKDDDELRQRTANLRQLQDMVRHSYPRRPRASKPRRAPAPRRWLARAALFAPVLLTGTLMGWLGHDQFDTVEPGSGASPRASSLSAAFQPGKQATAGVLLHLSSADPARIRAALDSAEDRLQQLRQHSPAARVEVLVNGRGLDMLRADTSSSKDRIHSLQQKYQNLTFIACQKAIERLKLTQGVDAQLLQDTEVASSALDQVLLRLGQGWSYVRI
jgi:intracellular sulfur oxidation DsrE/DsrF family protein